ncbi:methyltransferase domain-containing protein [Sphingomicrobium sp. XHP0235]|uniref:methyltransferase domain-containing protein n=1 Tax=Sphingomicrobium aquimarinum TaxID=3133971 RepID=UPI0031FE9B9D
MLAERRVAEEMMDDPALDADTYRDVVHDLARVNTVTLARRPTLDFVKRAVGARRQFRLLDVGYGDGDMLRAVARWAERRSLDADLVGIDLNVRSLAAAREATPEELAIDYQTGDYAALGDEPFDLIVSSLVAHHMTRAELLSFLTFMDRHARLGWFVNDLHRNAVAYMGWPLLAAAMRWHPIVRHDGRVSIARSFRTSDWEALLAEARIEGARTRRVFPFRLCVEKLR